VLHGKEYYARVVLRYPMQQPCISFDTLWLSLQVKVKDRSVVTTADAETRAVTPEGLQSRIKADVAATPSGVF